MNKSPKPAPPSIAYQAFDALVNTLTGLGNGGDRGSAWQFQPSYPLLPNQTFDIYADSGLAQRLITTLGNLATRRGPPWKAVEMIDGKEGEQLWGADDQRLGISAAVEEAINWSRLDGGAIIVPVLADGFTNLTLPLAPARIRRVEALNVFDRIQIAVQVYSTDPLTGRQGKPEIYRITPKRGTPFNIHYSRCFVFTGEPVPPSRLEYFAGFGMPAFQGLRDSIAQKRGASHSLANLLQDISLLILKLPSLQAKMTGAEKVAMQTRLDAFKKLRSFIGLGLLAGGEEIERVNAQMAGLGDIIKSQTSDLSMNSGLPEPLLAGAPPSGLRTDDGWENAVTALVEGYQETRVKPVLFQYYTMLAGANRYRGDWRIVFTPLQRPTDDEVAATEKTQAEAFKTRSEAVLSAVGAGVISTQEARALLYPDLPPSPPAQEAPPPPEDAPPVEEEGEPVQATDTMSSPPPPLITPSPGKPGYLFLMPDADSAEALAMLRGDIDTSGQELGGDFDPHLTVIKATDLDPIASGLLGLGPVTANFDGLEVWSTPDSDRWSVVITPAPDSAGVFALWYDTAKRYFTEAPDALPPRPHITLGYLKGACRPTVAPCKIWLTVKFASVALYRENLEPLRIPIE